MLNRYVASIFIVTLLTYLTFAGRFKFEYPKTNRDYFTRLSYSFLQSKLDVSYPGYSPNDLAFYKGTYYLYWGPLPALILLPFVYFLGTDMSDIFYTAVFGAINIFLISILFLEFKRYCKLRISTNLILLLVICFAFGTIHFYLSILGTVWFTSQIISLTAYLLSLFFLFQYLNSNKYSKILLSVVFLGLTALGKYTFLLSLPLYLGVLYHNHKLAFNQWVKLSSVLFLFITLIFIYNHLRFGSPFNNGLKFMQVNPKFYSDIANYGYFNPHYISRNLYYFLLNPYQFVVTKPFISPDPNGNSIFFTSPIFILLLISWYQKHFKVNKLIAKYILLSIILMMFPVVLYYGGGWYQWGYRYALDIYPLLFLLLLLIINKYEYFVVLTLVIISILINLCGTYWMMEFAKYAYF